MNFDAIALGQERGGRSPLKLGSTCLLEKCEQVTALGAQGRSHRQESLDEATSADAVTAKRALAQEHS